MLLNVLQTLQLHQPNIVYVLSSYLKSISTQSCEDLSDSVDGIGVNYNHKRTSMVMGLIIL